MKSATTSGHVASIAREDDLPRFRKDIQDAFAIAVVEHSDRATTARFRPMMS